jgi:hypothetical protein
MSTEATMAPYPSRRLRVLHARKAAATALIRISGIATGGVTVIGGPELEYMAEKEQEYRRAVLYPRAERRMRDARELAALRQGARVRDWRRAPAGWLGERLVRAGERLRARAAPTAEQGPFDPAGISTAPGG